MYSTASLTFWIFSASSSGISMPNASSKAITSSTVSRESAPRSSTKEASGFTSSACTPSCSTMMLLTFSSTEFDIRNPPYAVSGKPADSHRAGAGFQARGSVAATRDERPFSVPAALLADVEPAADVQARARDVGRQVGYEVEDRARDVVARP